MSSQDTSRDTSRDRLLPLPSAIRNARSTATSQPQWVLKEISGATLSLKTRLLEIGLTVGTPFEATRNGGHFLIRLRGDTLLLREREAEYLLVII